MRRAKILEEIPELSERSLDYLAMRGHVKFTIVPEGDVNRHDYPSSEIPYLRCVASLLKQDLPPRKASKKAREEFPE